MRGLGPISESNNRNSNVYAGAFFLGGTTTGSVLGRGYSSRLCDMFDEMYEVFQIG